MQNSFGGDDQMMGSGDDRIVHCILAALQNAAVRIIAYGDAARTGSAGYDEADIAVITPYQISEDQEERLSNAVDEFNRKHNTKYSVIDIDVAAFAAKQEEIQLYRQIEKTGTVLWAEEAGETGSW